ncbi:glycosyltransferase family 4 protein [Desulfobacter postgatei]|uniref:Glycosyltransferase n=1 Tax=Desulfobacter postgatei 2ac9 TaxID=879212 RepID=I5B6K3_9BACT|nr:glycosyltransferase [Desulfobacter postgatei]EIM65116.1 glycosyltransferase [Desulfobacter postgatei 2ac9]
MKKKIAYMNSGFFDTDITVIKELQKYYQVDWFVVNNELRYSNEFFRNYVCGTDIKLHLYKYKRLRDFKLIYIYLKIALLILKNNMEIIFTATYEPYWCFWATLLVKRNRLVMGVHDVLLHSDWKMPRLLKWGRGYLFFWLKHFVLYSQSQKKEFENKYKKDCHLVYMSSKNFGVPTVERPPIENKVRLLFWGNIQRYKGVDLLIDSVEELYHQGYKNFEVSIYGNFRTNLSIDEHYPELCKEKIKTISLYNLQFRYLLNEEIPDLLMSHHFFILPYRDATQSGPMMAAINYSLPIIAPDFGCFSEILEHGTNSILYNSKKEDGLTNSILRALEMNSKEYGQLLKKCDELKTIFSEENIGMNYKKCFDKIIYANSVHEGDVKMD